MGIKEVKPEDWAVKVYKPAIQNRWERPNKKPGYGLIE
jgi:phenylpyruvate tautomerase PptA (4-oxalocrotonate tautomerase family)